MFAVARYAADQTDEWYKNNFIISDRSSKRNWGFGFGFNILGYSFLGKESLMWLVDLLMKPTRSSSPRLFQ